MIDQPDFIATAIKLFSALLLVLGIFIGVIYLLRRVLKRDAAVPGRKLIRIIDRSYIGVKKSVALMEVSGKILVLGVTNDHISLLTLIEDPDSVERLRGKTHAEPAPMPFSTHLGRLLTKTGKAGAGKEASSSVGAEID